MWVSYAVCVAWTTVLQYSYNSSAQVAYFFCCLLSKDTPRNPIDKPGWTLTFQDDFTSGAIDPATWNTAPYGVRYHTGKIAQGIIPAEYYPDTNFSFGPSTVKLTTKKEATTLTDPNYPPGPNVPFTIPYTSAWMNWQPSANLNQRLGYFEIRCKVENTPAMWPAFWLCSPLSWPPELDVFEFNTTGQTNTFFSTVHWGQDNQMQQATHRVCRPAGYFHIYACEWTETEFRWYLDNTLVRVTSAGIPDFTAPMYVIVSTGVVDFPGGDASDAVHNAQNSTFPNNFEVDYVRCYKR
jgi:beta-glucanase (GH16 family)